MIVLHPFAQKTLADYGIDIPVTRSRGQKILNTLLQGPHLSSHQKKWFYSGSLHPIAKHDLLRVHEQTYVENALEKNPEHVAIQTYELLDQKGDPHRYNPSGAKKDLRELIQKGVANCEGTYTAALLALESGFAYHLGGGMHHAMSFGGRGFCPFNDIVVTIRKLRHDRDIQHVWVVDMDAHKGDGTAELCFSDKLTKTLSIHMASGWPLDTPCLTPRGYLTPPWYPSTVDIPIPAGGEDEYNTALMQGIELMESLSRNEIPELIIVVDGSDPYEKDGLESTKSLNLTLDQMHTRDIQIYHWIEQRGIPHVWLMAGGYGDHSHEVYEAFLTDILKKRYLTE